MEALYAFSRISDDLADETCDLAVKTQRLLEWRAGLVSAIAGKPTHPVHPALAASLRRFDIPERLLFDIIDGVESDLEPIQFATFDELYPYCYRVASAVGLACIRIWGLRPGSSADEAAAAAESAGIAFQLTNILRDLREDLARGRVYLPDDELARFGLAMEGNGPDPTSPAFRSLMHFQITRAEGYYHRAEKLHTLLSPEGRAVFRVMEGTYRQLLGEITRDVSAVLARRVRVPRWRKAMLLAEGWAALWNG